MDERCKMAIWHYDLGSKKYSANYSGYLNYVTLTHAEVENSIFLFV